MPKLIANVTQRFLPRTRRLLSSRRRGSILIMVVAVLVLLALMGTAYISTARLDRQSAEQVNQATAQEVIEQLLPAIEDTAERVIIEDVLTLAQGYRPPFILGVSTYDHWDSPITNYYDYIGAPPTGIALNDAWLGSRAPEELGNPNWPPNSRVLTWRTISRPITQPMIPASGTLPAEELFFSPYRDPTLALPAPPNPLAKYPQWTQDALTQRMAISEITITYPKPFNEPSLEGKTRVFPALMPVTLAGDPMPDPMNRIKYLAADADGDGIADSGLVPIMDGDIGGVRYFYAVRIIDHGSAVNVNTARARAADFPEGQTAPNPTQTPNRGFFPSNIGLAEMLVTYNNATGLSAEMDELNRYKYGYLISDAGPFSLNVATPWEEWPWQANNAPVNRSADFKFDSPTPFFGQGYADWAMRGMRLDNPGIRDPQSTSIDSDDLKYQAFSWTDAASLAYRGGTLINPRSSDPTINSGIPSGALEGAFYRGGFIAAAHDSVYRSAPNYMPTVANRFTFLPTDKANYWYRYVWDSSTSRQTDWTNPGTNPDASALPLPALPVRGLLTARNPVSNSINLHAESGGNVPNDAMLPYNHEGRWSPYRAYAKGDIVIWGAPAAELPGGPVPYQPTAAYICINGYTEAQALAELPEPLETFEPDYAAPNGHWARIIPRGQHAAGAYGAGHAVTLPPVVGASRQVYVCFEPAGTATVPPSADWYALPLAETPPKVSLNTAPFGELFRGFYNVMADMAPQRTPFDAAIAAAVTLAEAADPAAARANEGAGMPGTFNDPYVGNKFEGIAPFAPVLVSAPPLNPVPHPGAMLRSPIRAIPQAAAPLFPDEKVRLPADQVLLLRAAIAAVNAEDMRDRDMDVTGRLVRLQAHFGAVAGRQPVDVTVYGCEPQPFITEVFANNDDFSGDNPMGYVAVELHNPYPFPIPLAGFQIIAVDRDAAVPNPTPDPMQNHRVPGTVICDFSDPTTFGFMGAPTPLTEIPPGGYVVLENYNDGTAPATVVPMGGPATVRPASSGLPPAGPVPGLPLGVAFCYVPGLSDAPLRTVLNHEMMIVKRRDFDGGFSAGTYDIPGGAVYDDNPATTAFPGYVKHMVPVDSYDFTGLPLGAGVGLAGLRKNIHYARQVQPGLVPGTWKFVYPGRYDGALSSAGALPAPSPRSRQQGTHEATWDPGGAPPQTDPWDYTFPPGSPPATITLAQIYAPGGAPPAPAAPGSNNNFAATFPREYRIQWANGNFDLVAGDEGANVGFNRVNPGGNLFPFGGFMRNGDVLHVPFIGAYCIVDPTPGLPVGAFFEMNAVTMDAAMAEDTFTTNDDPLVPETGAYNEYKEQLGHFFPPSNPTAMPGQAYDWASDVLDHFTAIQNPHDDFYGGVNPTRYPVPPGGVRTPGVSSDGGRQANTEIDQQVPIEGLVNVNTASVQVLSQLPLVIDAASGQVNPLLTRRLAESIVYFRDIDGGSGQPHGPFKNLFELNRVVDPAATSQGFRNMMTPSLDTADSEDVHGDYTPVGVGTDFVNMDYEERYGQLIRLSNLITTRSDTFTVYVLVQGWKNVGTEYPVLVAERRSAFIADRSRINSTNGALNVVPVSTR